MVISLTPDGLAEAIERARFALLRQGSWDYLREGERKTRTEILRNAMDTSGVTMRLQALELRAQQTDDIADLLQRRDADFKRRLALDDTEIVRLSDTIIGLTAQLAAVTAEREAATTLAASASEKLAAIREVLDEVRPAARAEPGQVPTQAPAPTTTTKSAQARRVPRRKQTTAVSIATGQ